MSTDPEAKKRKRGKRIRFADVFSFGAKEKRKDDTEDEATVPDVLPATEKPVVTDKAALRHVRSSRKKPTPQQVLNDLNETASSDGLEQPYVDEDDESSTDSELFREEQSNLYNIPGAFRVSKKMYNNRRIEEIILEDGSIESGLTVKTPPVVVPSASLVNDSTREVLAGNEAVQVATGGGNLMYFSKRTVFLCLGMTCFAFLALAAGLVFVAAGQPHGYIQANNTGTGDLEAPLLSGSNAVEKTQAQPPTVAPTVSNIAQTVAPFSTMEPHTSSPTDMPTGQVNSTPSPTVLQAGIYSPVQPTLAPSIAPTMKKGTENQIPTQWAPTVKRTPVPTKATALPNLELSTQTMSASPTSPPEEE